MIRFSALRNGIVAFAILALLGLIALKLNPNTEVVHAGALFVVDGDTLADHGQRLRLRGIDAPEAAQTCERTGGGRWDCGQASTEALRALVRRGAVSCRGSELDRYRRRLVLCRAGALDINRAMVLSGMALSYGLYAAEERMAEAGRAGVWAGPFERPADWRHHSGAAGEEPHPPATLLGAMLQVLGIGAPNF